MAETRCTTPVTMPTPRLEASESFLEEGFSILLFVGKSQYYVEKFEDTDIHFGELTKSGCARVSDSFSLTFKNPTNRTVYSRYSAFVNF